jgi:type VI protein secretion system component VasK
MNRIPRVATVIIFVLMLGGLFCFVFLSWDFFQKQETITLDMNRYLAIGFILCGISFLLGIIFMSGQRSYNFMNFCDRINNSEDANNCILALDKRKKIINDGIPDFIEVKIVTPPAIKK